MGWEKFKRTRSHVLSDPKPIFKDAPTGKKRCLDAWTMDAWWLVVDESGFDGFGVSMRLSFVIILHGCYKRSQHPRKPTHRITCCYYLLYHLAKFMLPKRRFWKDEQILQNAFSKHFSTILSPNRVLTPLKSASKMHSETLVQPSKIFVWEG